MSTLVSDDLPSSIVIAPSFPTLSIASAMMVPILLSLAGSLAAIEATCRMSSCVFTSRLCAEIAFTAASTALSIPIFSCIGSAPAVTFFSPSCSISCPNKVAVVVPSPATSLVLVAIDSNNCAPIFS